MKALTITQPWASLIAIGAKRIETRGWRTSYRGPLAIHAAKGFPRWAKEFTQEPPVSVLFGMHYEYPRGSVLAICRLVACVRTEDLLSSPACAQDMTEQEKGYGDYGEDRWGWMLADIKAIAPVPAKGALSLWEWNPPA